jgi:hypothetical protein
MMVSQGCLRRVVRLAMFLVAGALCIGPSAKAAPLSDTPPDPNGMPSVYHSDAFDAYTKVKIGWLPAPPALTAAEQAPEATALAVINQHMAEVAADLAKKQSTAARPDMTVTADRLRVTMAGVLPDNRRVICVYILPGNKFYSTVIMSVDRDHPLVDPREVWDEDGMRQGKGVFAQFVTDTLRVNTWEGDTFEGLRIRMCEGH